MSASKLGLALLALASCALAVELPLLEASGAASGALLVAGAFSNGTYGAVLQSTAAGGKVLLLGGPTPHVLETYTDTLPAGVPFAGVAATGLVPSSEPDTPALCVLQRVASGVMLSAVAVGSATPVQSLAVPGAVSVAAVASNSLVVLCDPTFADPAAKPFQTVSADAAGVLSVTGTSDLGVAAKKGWLWRAVGATTPLMGAARQSADGRSLDVFLFSTQTSPPTLTANVSLDASSTAPVIGIAVADVYGDGAPALMVTYADSTTDSLWLTDGADALYRAASFPLDPAAPTGKARWVSAAYGSWLGSDPSLLSSESQVMGLRAAPLPAAAGAAPPPPAFHTDLLLFGRPEHWLRRRASVSNVRAMQEFKTTFADNGPNVDNLTYPLDVERFKSVLASAHANTYDYSVCDCAWSKDLWSCSTLYNYDDFVRFLEATKDFKVDGQQLRVWIGLYPPSEAAFPPHGAGCRPPTDSSLTPFNETALWGGDVYTNYTRWGDLVGRLGALYPHLVAMDIDDFSSNVVTGVFTGDYVARITANMRARAPHMALASVVYQAFDDFPDLALMLDAPVFFFRNAMEGAQTCAPASCPWGPHAKVHEGSCLAGVCSEPTTYNAPLEIAKVVAGMPASRQVITGYYATGHSSSGAPTPRYVSRLLQTLAAQNGVSGVMTYCAKAALQPCAAPPLFAGGDREYQLGCIVRRAYRAIAGAQD